MYMSLTATKNNFLLLFSINDNCCIPFVFLKLHVKEMKQQCLNTKPFSPCESQPHFSWRVSLSMNCLKRRCLVSGFFADSNPYAMA
jgi:hypothetical protein